ncbi:MAG: hypothetical protein HSCHL_2427 [Hydrogenibacillus schlegelii]|uniref:Uncharacterized protein n=1 Tax=Hydrogenibacillus schlegelii TaxID=1484 RepID=A0A2T5G9T7_HYDSH|nr:MAG: hypothetical protein HSCHL_2427 [Hydrogenibacillus schlegelii]
MPTTATRSPPLEAEGAVAMEESGSPFLGRIEEHGGPQDGWP